MLVRLGEELAVEWPELGLDGGGEQIGRLKSRGAETIAGQIAAALSKILGQITQNVHQL